LVFTEEAIPKDIEEKKDTYMYDDEDPLDSINKLESKRIQLIQIVNTQEK
jgi:TolA-binding protein